MLVLPIRSSRRQSGIALVTVILIIALFAALVSRFSLLNQIWMRQVDNHNAFVQASQATRAAQIWASSIIGADENNYDAHTDSWAQPILPVPIAWGEMYGWIEDMQSRFNLNNLVDAQGQVNVTALLKFKQLLKQLELKEDLVEAIVDWIDSDGIPYGQQGAEDAYYLNLKNPYMTANRPFLDEQEIKLVKGIDHVTWNRLKPFITALPEFTQVNINTASTEILAAMLYNSESPVNFKTEIDRLVADIYTAPFNNIGDFSKRVSNELNIKNIDRFSVDSNYFKAHTQVTFGNVDYRMMTLYERKSGDVRILHQSRSLF